jgi:hypothetical protein
MPCGVEENVCRVLVEYRRLESHYSLVVTLSNYNSFFKAEEDALKKAWTSFARLSASPVADSPRRARTETYQKFSFDKNFSNFV